MRYVAILLLLLLVGLANAANPASELRDAAADAKGRSTSTRYLSLYNLPEAERADAVKVANFVLNSVSRSSRMVYVERATETLVRFDLAALGIDTSAWESLVESENYWHLRTEVLVNGKRRIVTVDGGWAGLLSANELRAATGSLGALARLDWFVAKVATTPTYYAMAGVSDSLGGWYRDLGADAETIVKLKANTGQNLFRSGVTQKPRRLSRWQGPLGAVLQTYDTFNVDPKHDPIRNPGYSVGTDAHEVIASKANGLHVYGLYDGKGKRQESVPDRIAKDDTDIHGDKVLAPMLSCVRCHSRESGLRSFSFDQRDMLKKGVDIQTQNPVEADSLANFYLSTKLERDMKRDREDYADAVAEATGGMKPEENAAALSKVVDDYAHADVTPEIAKRELGAESLEGLRVSRDGVLLALWVGKAVQRKQFEQSYAEAALLAR